MTGGFRVSVQKSSRGDASVGLAAKILERTGDSLENFSVLRGVTLVIQSDYSSLQSTYGSPDRVIGGGRAGGEANVEGNRDAPREIGAGLDIRVYAVRSAVTAMLTAWASSPSPRPSPPNRCPAKRPTAATLTRPLLSAAVQMGRTFKNSSVNRVVRVRRDSMPGTLSSESRRRTTRASPKRRNV